VDSELGVYYLFIILNSGPNPQRVAIPEQEAGRRWYRVLDTSLPGGEDFLEAGKEVALNPADFYFANPRTTVLLLGR
jgi:glycogen operon protein